MSESKDKKDSPLIYLVGIAVILLPVMVATAATMAIVMSMRNRLPNPNGAVAQSAVDPTDPSTEKLVDKVEAAVQPAKALQKDKKGFQRAKDNLDLIITDLSKNTRLSDADKQRIGEIIDRIRANYQWLEQQSANPKINQETIVTQKTNEIATWGDELKKILYAGILPGGVSRPDLSVCQSLANNPKVIFDHPNDRAGFKTGRITRRTSEGYGETVELNTKICGILQSLLDNGIQPLKLMSVIGTHHKFVIVRGVNTGRISAHWGGNAMDLYMPNWSAQKELKIMKWVVENEAALKAANLWPRQMIGGQAGFLQPYFIYRGENNGNTHTIYEKSKRGHNDHVHIGF